MRSRYPEWLAPVGVFTVAIGGVLAFGLLNPPKTETVSVGPVLSVESTGTGNSVVATRERRFEVHGIWPGVAGEAVEVRTIVKGVGSKSLPFPLAPELCSAGGRNCTPIQNQAA